MEHLGVARRRLCQLTAVHRLKTFAFLDLETSGFISGGKADRERVYPKIIEISMIAVERGCLERMSGSSQLPRVLHKLTLPVNPGKALDQRISSLTGLNNSILAGFANFSPLVSSAVVAFLSCLMAPICLVAHNGRLFDFPIFAHHVASEATSEQSVLTRLLCTDSLILFKELDANVAPQTVPVPSTDVTIPASSSISDPPPAKRYNLSSVYRNIYGTVPAASHGAEADAETLLRCAGWYGSRFTELCDQRAEAFLVAGTRHSKNSLVYPTPSPCATVIG